jgi:hypothetical protein
MYLKQSTDSNIKITQGVQQPYEFSIVIEINELDINLSINKFLMWLRFPVINRFLFVVNLENNLKIKLKIYSLALLSLTIYSCKRLKQERQNQSTFKELEFCTNQ